MDTAVWTFLIIVVLVSLMAYFFLKKFSVYYADVKTKKMIEQFNKETGLNLENKSFDEVEKEFKNKLTAKSKQLEQNEQSETNSKNKNE